MSRVVAFALLACLAVGPAFAQSAPSTPVAATPVCGRPTAPTFPLPAAAGAQSLAQMQQFRASRDDFFAAADRTLACLDQKIDAQVRVVFASGAAMGPDLRQMGRDHQALGRERAAAHESFLRLCLAWEDAKLTTLPGGCEPAIEGTPAQKN